MSYIFKRGWINISITIGIDSFDKYINEMEDFLSNQLNELEKQFKIDTINSDSTEAENIFEYQYEDKFFYFREEFPNILRKSFIISLYSFLEQELNRICLHLEKNNNFEITLDKPSNDTGIFKYYNFLSKVAKVNVSSINYEWKEIKKINKIRNHFVHNGNDVLDKVIKPIGKKENMMNQTIKAFLHFGLAEEDKVYTEYCKSIKDRMVLKYDVKITSEFCKEALNITKNFFDKLTDLLKLY